MSGNRIKEFNSKESIVPTMCSAHCGGTCLLRVHIKDGVIIRIETDDGKEEPQLRACLRGRSYRQRVYAPDRLKYPMKRVGARGEGKFERITWDEALDTVAGELKRVKETYGSAAIIHWASAASAGLVHCLNTRIARLLCMMGGCTLSWGVHSYEGAIFAEEATYGTNLDGNTYDDLVNSRLIILWGWDPVVTIGHTNTAWFLAQAKEAGARIISIDPKYNDSAAVFAEKWIPIRPGTDGAMMLSIAYVMIRDNLQDQRFLDTYTVGFDKFRDYVLGIEDGLPKTPAWASAITGVPAATIENMAREYATTRPAALLGGIAPGRTAHGEQFHRLAHTLAAMTGNIGIPGGSAGEKAWNTLWLMKFGGGRMMVPPNQVEANSPPMKDVRFPMRLAARRESVFGTGPINLFTVVDAILKGKSGGYPADYKLIYLSTSNIVNQWPNTNKTIQALKKLEFVVVEEQFMTATAKFADILLPTTTLFERNDISLGRSPAFIGLQNKIIEPLYESKPGLQIANELAARLGITDYNDKTDEEWVKEVVQNSEVPDYEAIKKDAIYRSKVPQPHIGYSKQIEDPANNPFRTPSGKIEIYSQQLADMKNPRIPAIPKYMETWESLNDPLAKKYPLQLITTHFRRRAHSQFDNIPWLRELEPQAVKISTADAQARGIREGDLVRVFNDRGDMIIPARVTERIMPGVIDIPQGAWYSPDEKGVDRGGCANVLTKDEPSAVGSMPVNTALVQVEKA